MKFVIVCSLIPMIVGSCPEISIADQDQGYDSETCSIPQAGNIVNDQQTRITDRYGSGQYGASRDKATRTHSGIDIVVESGEKIFMPITGTIVRQAMPYKDDSSYKGLVIKGNGDWNGYELKVFYVEGLISGEASQGKEIGTSQDMANKYPGIINHIHLEVRFLGVLVDPFELWQYSF